MTFERSVTLLSLTALPGLALPTTAPPPVSLSVVVIVRFFASRTLPSANLPTAPPKLRSFALAAEGVPVDVVTLSSTKAAAFALLTFVLFSSVLSSSILSSSEPSIPATPPRQAGLPFFVYSTTQFFTVNVLAVLLPITCPAMPPRILPVNSDRILVLFSPPTVIQALLLSSTKPKRPPAVLLPFRLRVTCSGMVIPAAGVNEPPEDCM